ncbi:MAG: hypothetical protein NZZ60_06230 [Bacteroidia bacterium]|nr:hypothetical protein [Bacteroidia bacterium]
MQAYSLTNTWELAWSAFKRHWLVGVLLSVLYPFAGFIPIVGNVAVLILSLFHTVYGLKAWNKSEPITFQDITSESFTTYLKMFLGVLLNFLPILIAVLISLPQLTELNAKAQEELISPETILAQILDFLTILLIAGLFSILIVAALFAYPYFVLDKKMDVFTAIQHSLRFFTDNILRVFLFLITSWLIHALGMLICCIGLFLTIPISSIAAAGVYKQLVDRTV